MSGAIHNTWEVIRHTHTPLPTHPFTKWGKTDIGTVYKHKVGRAESSTKGSRSWRP